jgi:hypothetical protein
MPYGEQHERAADRQHGTVGVIHLGGEAAAIVPLADLRRLQR